MFVVTGANGFIGSAMVWELNRQGHKDIIAVDRVSPRERPELLNHLSIDQYIDAEEFLKILDSSSARDFKAVFHMGACSSTTEMNVEYLAKNNTDYTKSVFLSGLKNSWPLIYASSGAVYGQGEKGFDDAISTSEFHPLNPYGWSKAHFDIWAEKQTKTPPRWYGLRFFNVYGPNEYHKEDMSSVVYKAFKQIGETGRLKLFRSHNSDFEDGCQLRDFVYVKDITSWMWELYSGPSVQSGIYNLGFGKARTWLDLAKAVFENMNRKLEIEWIDMPASIRNQYQYFTEAKMSKLLGQGVKAPQWSLEKGIQDYLQKYLLQKDAHLS